MNIHRAAHTGLKDRPLSHQWGCTLRPPRSCTTGGATQQSTQCYFPEKKTETCLRNRSTNSWKLHMVDCFTCNLYTGEVNKFHSRIMSSKLNVKRLFDTYCHVGLYVPNIDKRLCLMHLHFTYWTILVVCEVTINTCLANYKHDNQFTPFHCTACQ